MNFIISMQLFIRRLISILPVISYIMISVIILSIFIWIFKKLILANYSHDHIDKNATRIITELNTKMTYTLKDNKRLVEENNILKDKIISYESIKQSTIELWGKV